MQLHVSTNKFNTEPFWIEPIRSVFACPPKQSVELFDQNGYDLTHLEQLYAVANGVDKTEHRNKEEPHTPEKDGDEEAEDKSDEKDDDGGVEMLDKEFDEELELDVPAEDKFTNDLDPAVKK